MKNLAGKREYKTHVKRLRSKLDSWMKEQGDEGVKTELRAGERQGGGRKKKSKK